MKSLTYFTQKTLNLVHKIGFFRITLIPMGLVIIVSAYRHGILGMGLIGLVVLIFGLLNKCLLMGKCDTNTNENSNKVCLNV